MRGECWGECMAELPKPPAFLPRPLLSSRQESSASSPKLQPPVLGSEPSYRALRLRETSEHSLKEAGMGGSRGENVSRGGKSSMLLSPLPL